MNQQQLQDCRFRIWQLRRAGRTQKEIAAKLGLSESAINDINQWLADDFLPLLHRVLAEQQKCGDPNIDRLEEQATMLELAQSQLEPGSTEFLARAEHICRMRLKCAELRAQLRPNKRRSSFWGMVLTACSHCLTRLTLGLSSIRGLGLVDTPTPLQDGNNGDA